MVSILADGRAIVTAAANLRNQLAWLEVDPSRDAMVRRFDNELTSYTSRSV